MGNEVRTRTMPFPKDEWEDVRSRLDSGKIVHTIRVDDEYGRYGKGDCLKTEWGQEIEVMSVREVSGGLDGLKKEYGFFDELTERMVGELRGYDKMEIIVLRAVGEG